MVMEVGNRRGLQRRAQVRLRPDSRKARLRRMSWETSPAQGIWPWGIMQMRPQPMRRGMIGMVGARRVNRRSLDKLRHGRSMLSRDDLLWNSCIMPIISFLLISRVISIARLPISSTYLPNTMKRSIPHPRRWSFSIQMDGVTRSPILFADAEMSLSKDYAPRTMHRHAH